MAQGVLPRNQKARYTQGLQARANIARRFMPLLSFALPFIVLYLLHPETFEATWKGRTYYLFFIWLVFLETLTGGKELQPKKFRPRSVRTVLFILSLALPTLYVIAAEYLGLNLVIATAASRWMPSLFANWMPLSTEYLALTVLFAITVSLNFGVARLSEFSIPLFFLGAIGTIYTIDNLYPYGRFTPFQIIVPTTASLAMAVLSLMGYHTRWENPLNNMPRFTAWSSNGGPTASFYIAWPCSGVESLLIYTITILLFLRKSTISKVSGMVFFTIGAVVTYFINILRIATVYILQMQRGDWKTFHDYYGQLYSITWIMMYPLIIIGSQILWNRFRNPKRRTDTEETGNSEHHAEI